MLKYDIFWKYFCFKSVGMFWRTLQFTLDEQQQKPERRMTLNDLALLHFWGTVGNDWTSGTISSKITLYKTKKQ